MYHRIFIKNIVLKKVSPIETFSDFYWCKYLAHKILSVYTYFNHIDFFVDLIYILILFYTCYEKKYSWNIFPSFVNIKMKKLIDLRLLPNTQKVKNFRSEVAKLLEQGFYRSAIRKLWKNSKKFRGSLLTFLSVIIKNEMKSKCKGEKENSHSKGNETYPFWFIICLKRNSRRVWNVTI